MLTKEKALVKAKRAHNDYYEYPDWKYSNSKCKIKIKCPSHGIFEQTYSNHVYSSKGCSMCKGGINKSIEVHIKECNNVHKGVYDYPEEQKIKNNLSHLKVICRKHGEFSQSIANHKSGHGCPDCANIFRAMLQIKDHDVFLKEANIVHNFFYKYPEKYLHGRYKMTITCPDHGDFLQSPTDHLQGKGCPKCVHKISKPEIEVQDFVKELGFEIITNNRKIIKGKELDIYIPKLNKAIEFNGTYWHYSDKYFKPGKHAKKSNLCREKGIKLLHIREDLWKKDQEKMKNVIKQYINKN